MAAIQPVEFPMVLDLYDLCAEDLKATLKEHRNILTEREDLRLQNRHGIKGKVSTPAIGRRPKNARIRCFYKASPDVRTMVRFQSLAGKGGREEG
jgi:hypothetical protein